MSVSAQLTVAVTGASGFLGGGIVDALLARGARVRAVVRSPERMARWAADPRVTIVRADLFDPPALLRAFAGVDAVIHSAAFVNIKVQAWEINDRTNRVGAENVVESLIAAGVRRCVHVSTIGVYDLPPPGQLWRHGPIREEHPLLTAAHRGRMAYRVTKALGEALVTERCARTGVALTVVRPSAMFGPGDRNLAPVLRRAFRWPILPAPIACFPFTYVGDVAEAIARSLEIPESAGRAFNLTGEPYVPVSTLLATWKHIAGARTRLVPVPPSLPIAFDNAAAKAVLHFRNRPMDEAVRAALREPS